MNPKPSRRLLAAALGLVGTVALAAADDPVDALARLSLEWVQTRAETARAETTWASHRELLQSTVQALEERARLLEAERELLKARTSKDRGEIERLEIEKQRLHAELAALEGTLRDVGDRLTALRHRLPPRLSEALELPYLSLADPELPAGDRMAHTITVINRCSQFNRAVTFGEEIVTLPGEARSKLLQTVYWGLSQGYAYDRGTHQAWIGSPGPEGWHWVRNDASAASLRELIASFDEKAVPSFVLVHASAGPAMDLPSTPPNP